MTINDIKKQIAIQDEIIFAAHRTKRELRALIKELQSKEKEKMQDLRLLKRAQAQSSEDDLEALRKKLKLF